MTFALSRWARSLGMALGLGSLASCGTPPAPVSPGREPPAVAPPDADSGVRFATVEVATLPGTVALHDPRRWRATSDGSFTVLEHAPSRSTLTLRVWRSARLVRPEECEAEARLARPALPRPDPEALVDLRELEAPRGFSGSLAVGVEPDPNGTHGFVLGIGAAVGHCFVFAFDTTADGANAVTTVAHRLRAAADQIAPSVTLRDVDERVRPERVLQ